MVDGSGTATNNPTTSGPKLFDGAASVNVSVAPGPKLPSGTVGSVSPELMDATACDDELQVSGVFAIVQGNGTRGVVVGSAPIP